MFFCLCPPSKIQVLESTDLQEQICVFKTYQLGMCSLYSQGSIEQQLQCISDFIQDSFTVSAHSEYMGKEAPRIQKPMGIHCKGVLRDLWPQLQQTVIKPQKV